MGNNEYLSDIPSPAANADYLFLCTTYGVLVCYDAETGEKYWEAEIGNSVISSPMLVENKVYVLDLNGVMHIFSADRQMNKIGTPALEGIFTATPAFTNGRIYIREDQTLHCIGQ
jgi:outer membrane protein assembly factor BamB